MSWDDRVSRFDHLSFEPERAPIPLFAGDGFEMVQELANARRITIVD
jgi:hypothetical protein